MKLSLLRNHILSLAFLFIAFNLGGCVVKDIGTTVEHTFKGDYYLSAEEYEKGRESFALEVAQNPDSALAHYYYGRFLLQDDEAALALAQLRRACTLDPDNPEYQFWAGLAYGGVGDQKNEEASYRRALELDSNHLQALIYLGHVELGKKRYEEALDLYARALDIWPASPSALYNRALILQRLGRSPEERRGWLSYLAYHPSGAQARQAVDYLNLLEDFTYRNHRLGARTVTTEKIWFEPFSARLDESSYASLDLIGQIYANLNRGKLQIVVYQKNNEKLARSKALNIKSYLTEEFSQLDPAGIGVSWFAEPHTFEVRKKRLANDESVSFFITKS